VRKDAPEQWDPADPDPFRSYGKAVHAILARVRVASDLPAAIAAEAEAWAFTPDEREDLQRRLAHLLELPAIQPFFAERVRVRNEVTIIDEKGDAHRPDRIVNDGMATRVLDIKTGDRSRDHKDQVLRYADLLRELGEQQVSAYLFYVREGIVEEVRP
jgi:hypothetical protein